MKKYAIISSLQAVLYERSSDPSEERGILALIHLLFYDLIGSGYTAFAFPVPNRWGKGWYDVADEFVALADMLQTEQLS